MATTLLQSELPGLTLRHRGKVRDVFDLPDDRLLIVATDRLSAFDVVLPDPIPGKGEMLCQISNFWFEQTAGLVPNHLTGIDVASVLPAGVARFDLGGEILMDAQEVCAAARLTPGVVIANRLEALDHCPVTRECVRAMAGADGFGDRVGVPDSRLTTLPIC